MNIKKLVAMTAFRMLSISVITTTTALGLIGGLMIVEIASNKYSQ